MDENKRKKLHEIGYRIEPCCGLCIYAAFAFEQPFGVCNRHRYDHLKHTDNPRQVSILRYGRCPAYEVAPQWWGPFEEFYSE